MAKLGEVCTIVSGSTPKTSVTSYWDGNIKWITPAELNEDTFYIMDSVRHITEEGKEKTGLSYLPAGTVILSSRAPIGKTAIAGCEMCCNQGFKNLICSDAIYNEYLYFFLKSKTDYLNSLGRGATFKEISKSIVESIEIPLPEVNQQKEIAEKFKKLEQLISLRKQQLAKLDELVKARFVEMFGDPIANPKQYKCYTVDDIIQFQGGSQPDKKFFEYEKTPDNIRLIQIRDYRTDKFATYIPTTMAKRFCTAEDIMIGRYGPPIFQILQGLEGSFNVALMKATPKRGNREFIRWFLKQDCLLHYLEGLSKRTAGQDGIQIDKLKAYPFPYPPDELQNEFATFVERVYQQKQTVQQSLDKLELMKKALMQEYFGGNRNGEFRNKRTNTDE
jgi:hypothetical protein